MIATQRSAYLEMYRSPLVLARETAEQELTLGRTSTSTLEVYMIGLVLNKSTTYIHIHSYNIRCARTSDRAPDRAVARVICEACVCRV